MLSGKLFISIDLDMKPCLSHRNQSPLGAVAAAVKYPDSDDGGGIP